MASFGLMVTSLFKIWTPAWSSASTSHFDKGISFFSWQNNTLSFFFGCFFFFSSAFDFFHEQNSSHKQRASSCEFRKGHNVNKLWKYHKKRAPSWVVAMKIPSGNLPMSKIITPSQFINFHLKLRFSKYLGCF